MAALNNPFTPVVTHSRAPRNAAAVTTSNSVDLPAFAYRGLYIGGAGDVKVDMIGGGVGIVFTAVPVGWLQVQVRRVYATGTTATNIVALY